MFEISAVPATETRSLQPVAAYWGLTWLTWFPGFPTGPLAVWNAKWWNDSARKNCGSPRLGTIPPGKGVGIRTWQVQPQGIPRDIVDIKTWFNMFQVNHGNSTTWGSWWHKPCANHRSALCKWCNAQTFAHTSHISIWSKLTPSEARPVPVQEVTVPHEKHAILRAKESASGYRWL